MTNDRRMKKYRVGIAVFAISLITLAIAGPLVRVSFSTVESPPTTHRVPLPLAAASPAPSVDAGHKDGGVEADTETPPDAPATLTEIETVLLLGVDRSEYRVGRTDAIMVAIFDHAKKEIGVISIPRDLWVDIPGLYEARINAVMRIGDLKLREGAGLPLLKRIVSEMLNIPINHTIAADFEGFVNIIDFLEGIPVNVVCPIEDCFHTDEVDAGCDPLVLNVGEHVMDGATALKFARSRHGRTDLDRARRQQAVLSGIKKRLTRPAIIPKLPRLWKKLVRFVQSDLDMVAGIRIGLLFAKTKASDLHGLVIRGPLVEEVVTEDGKQVLLLNAEAAKKAVANLFKQPSPGTRRKGAVCPSADVGLHWREMKHKQ